MPDHDPQFPAHPPELPEASFFPSTSEAAARVAAKYANQRYLQILAYLESKPGCIFEIAAALACFDHQISGRFGELVAASLIERTGLRRTKPATGCSCEEYKITLLGLAFFKHASKPPETPPEEGSK